MNYWKYCLIIPTVLVKWPTYDRGIFSASWHAFYNNLLKQDEGQHISHTQRDFFPGVWMNQKNSQLQHGQQATWNPDTEDVKITNSCQDKLVVDLHVRMRATFVQNFNFLNWERLQAPYSVRIETILVRRWCVGIWQNNLRRKKWLHHQLIDLLDKSCQGNSIKMKVGDHCCLKTGFILWSWTLRPLPCNVAKGGGQGASVPKLFCSVPCDPLRIKFRVLQNDSQTPYI